MCVWHRNKNDALSIQMWTLKTNYQIFFHKKNYVVGYLFTLGIQIQWQFNTIMKWDNDGDILMDATFGT